jgi:hypothetical protein
VRLRLDLDTETATALAAKSVEDLRPMDMEAEALLRLALGLVRCSLCPTPVECRPEATR